MQGLQTLVRNAALAGMALAIGGVSWGQAPANPMIDALNAQTALNKAETDLLKSETDQIKEEVNNLKEKFPQLTGGKDGAIRFEQGKGAYSIGAWEKVYRRIDEGSREICAAVASNVKGKEVLIATNEDLAASHVFAIASAELVRQRNQLQQLQRSVDGASVHGSDIGPAGAAAPPLAALSVGLSSAISIAKLFRTDRTLYAETVQVGDTFVKEQVLKCLRPAAARIKDPALVARYVLLTGSNSGFLSSLNQMTNEKRRAEFDISKKPAAKTPEATAVLAQADKFFQELLATPAGASEPPLARILRIEAVSQSIRNDGLLLVVGIAQQGGISMITSSAWHTDRLYVGGGAIVGYQLTRAEELVDSGIVPKVDPSLMHVNLEVN